MSLGSISEEVTSSEADGVGPFFVMIMGVGERVFI